MTGLVQPGQWHRIAFSADLGAGVVDIYLDATRIRHRTGASLRDGRFALNSNADPGSDLLLFNENYGDGTNYTLELLVSSLAFVGHTVTEIEIFNLGGSKDAGIFVIEEPLPSLTVAAAPPNIVLTWAAQPGVRLKRSGTLADGSWADVSLNIGAGTWSEPIISAGHSFFRLAR